MKKKLSKVFLNLVWDFITTSSHIFQNYLLLLEEWFILNQCLGSRSVGTARVWLSGSRFAKKCGSTIPDPGGKISTKNCKKKFTLNPILNFLKMRDYKKKSWSLNSSSFSTKEEENNLAILLCLKNSVNLEEMFNLDPDQNQN